MSNSVDPDETAHYEPSHLDLRCLQTPIIIAYGNEKVKHFVYIKPYKIFTRFVLVGCMIMAIPEQFLYYCSRKYQQS